MCVVAWFARQYPHAKVEEINAAIDGTGSDLGVFRIKLGNPEACLGSRQYITIRRALRDLGRSCRGTRDNNGSAALKLLKNSMVTRRSVADTGLLPLKGRSSL